MSRRRPLVATLLAVALAFWCALELRLGTDLTKFMPDRSDSELAGLLSALANSPLSRTLAITIEGDSLDSGIDAAIELASFLANDEGIAWVRSGIDAGEMDALYALYFRHRHGFLSLDPEREIPELVSDQALAERAKTLRARLATPAAPLLTRILADDPLGSFEALLTRLRVDQPKLTLRRGHLVSADGRAAVVIARTARPAFDSGAQAPLLDRLRAFADMKSADGNAIRLELAGASRFAVEAERAMKRDIALIATCGSLGIALVFFCLVGTLRAFLFVSLAPAAGILVATASGLWMFGALDGLTMAFGASLMGIAIDYANHLLVHQGLERGGASPHVTARRLRPSLLLGAATTIASVAGLGMTAFPAFREMGFFAAVGVSAALALTLFVLPDLLHHVPPLPQRARRSADALANALAALARAPRGLLYLPLGLGALSLLVLPQLRWSDAMSELTRFDPELLAEDQRVRARVDQLETSHLVIAVAADDEAALAQNDTIQQRLREAATDGEIDGARSLQPFVWSADLQRRNHEALTRDAHLPERLDRLFAEGGFRSGSFAPFAASLVETPGALTLGALRASPLRELIAPYLFDLGDDLAVVTYLQGATDLDAIEARLEDLDGVHVLDQRAFVDRVYREFRVTTSEQMIVGALLVIALLLVRYRAWRPALAAFLPSALTALILLALLVLSGRSANLLQVMALIMVMGMGVDYGIFLVDSAGRRADVGATLLSLLLSCLTTALVFGTLALSSQPALRAIGLTAGLGIVLSFVLAPVSLAIVGLVDGSERDDHA